MKRPTNDVANRAGLHSGLLAEKQQRALWFSFIQSIFDHSS